MMAGGVLLRGLQSAAALALLAMLLIVTIDVVGRHFFNSPLTGAIELTQYTMLIAVFAGLPVVTLRRSHISIGLLDGWFHGAARRVQSLVVCGISAAVLAAQAWVLWHEAAWLREMGNVIGYLQLPTWPAAYAMAVLSALAAVASAMAGLRAPPATASLHAARTQPAEPDGAEAPEHRHGRPQAPDPRS